MPRIPINKTEQDEWVDDDLEHDHLGRPTKTHMPRRPDPADVKRLERQERFERRPRRPAED